MENTFRWTRRISPHPDEALASFLRRWAAENLRFGRRQLLAEIGVSPAVRIDPRSVEKLAAALGVEHSILASIAPSDRPSVPTLRASLTRARLAPVCAACLTTGSHDRQLWAHAWATACPEHGTRLVDQCPGCSRPICVDRPSARTCRCGFDLRRIQESKAEACEIEVATLLMGAVRGQVSFPLNTSESVPANFDLFLAGFVAHFGKSRRAGEAVRPAKTTVPRSVGDAIARIEEAYEILGDWPVKFVARVDELLAEPARMSTASVARRLGPWYGFLFRQFTDGAYEQIRQAVANCIVATHDGRVDARTRNLIAFATVPKDWLTIAEAARELHVRPDRLATGVDDGRIAASVDRKAAGYTQRFLSRDEVRRLRAVQAAHVDENSAAKELGVSESVLRLMKEAGLIDASDPAVTPPVTKGFVLARSLESLRARVKFEQLPIADQTTDKYIALRDLNLRRTTDRQRMIRLLRELFSGGIANIWRDGSGRLGGVLLNAKEVQDRIASQAPDMALTVQQISQITSSHFDAVRAWIDSGLLPATQRTDRQGRPWLVQLDDLIRFLMTYAPLATLAAATDSSSRGLAARLTESGVELVGAGSNRGSLVRIVDCVVASTAEREAGSVASPAGAAGEGSGSRADVADA